MAPPSLDMLHLASARRSTFNKSRKGQNRALNWPYPLTAAAAKSSTIHPDRLVEAGFYCTPTVDDPTVTTCYLCEIVVGQWEEGEDPLYRHEAAIEEAGIRCAYLDVWNQSWSPAAVETSDDDEGAYLASVPQSEWNERWSGDGAEYHPRSDRMHDARLATFRLGWPHEGAAGVPTKEDIAAAGWVFRPGADEESEDQCACIYCGRTVEGWEEGDDPIALHRRKIGLKCPFFIADNPPAAADEAVAEAQTDAEPVGEEKQQQQPEEEEEQEEEEPEPVKPKRGAKKASVAPGASTAKKVARGPSTKKKGKEPLREADREDDHDDEQEDPTPTAAAAAPDSREEEDADEEELAPKATKKGKAKAAPKKSAAARPTTTRSTRAKTTPAVSEAEDVPDQGDVSVMRKSTRARAASNASTASSVPPPRAAALSKSTRSRAPALSTSTAAESSEVEKRAPLDVFTAEESTEVEIVKPKRTSKKAQQPKKTVVARATSDEGTSPDDSLAQLALIADAALEAQGPAAIEEEAPTKKSKKPSPSAASSTSSSSSSGKAKKGKKADAESPPIEVDAPVRDSPKEVAMQDEAPEPIAAASAPTSPRAAPDPAPLSVNRPIRSLPSNKSSRSPSSATRALVSSSTAAPPPPLPSASSSQSSLPTSAFETASERLSAPAPVPTVVDPAAPFVAPTNPFAGSSLLSLVPPPTQHELDSLTVAEWYTLCYDRIRARFENENAALRNHLEARLDLGRNKLRDMADEAKAREDREAAEDAENRRRIAKERKERIGASGGGTRSAVKAGGGGGSTRKMR